MRKIFFGVLLFTALVISVNSVMACNEDCDCGCRNGQECTCNKEEIKCTSCKPECDCKGNCKCAEECTCNDNCKCTEKKFFFFKKKKCTCQ